MSSNFSFKQCKSNTFRDEKARNRNIRETKLIHNFTIISVAGIKLKIAPVFKTKPVYSCDVLCFQIYHCDGIIFLKKNKLFA